MTVAAFGLLNVIDSLGVPWGSLLATLVMALLALAFFAAAQHSSDKRMGWLLSASVAAGLTIADFYNLINAAAAAAVLVTFIAVLLFVVRDATRLRPRRRRRPCKDLLREATAYYSSSQIEKPGSRRRAA